jgi:hypothetical protein
MTHYIEVQWLKKLMRCTCLWGHDAHAHAVWCLWCKLVQLGYPHVDLVIARSITGRERICVASHILIAKIPSAPLVTITWLQHPWCPRFRCSTFGYGITTSPTREVEYEYGISTRVHVSSPKVPKCICHAMHTQKVTSILIQIVVSKTKKLSSGLSDRINHDWREFLGRVWYSSQIFWSDHNPQR